MTGAFLRLVQKPTAAEHVGKVSLDVGFRERPACILQVLVFPDEDGRDRTERMLPLVEQLIQDARIRVLGDA